MLRFFCSRGLLAFGMCLAALPALPALAQQAPETAVPVASPELKDGAYRRNGQVFRLQNGRSSVLTRPLSLGNGYTLQPSGVLLEPSGSRRQLRDGQAVNQQGEVVNLRDDMLTARAIEQHDQRTTGAQPTVIEVPAGHTLDLAVLAQFQRAQQRLYHVQQLTHLLAERASLPAGPASAALDQRIRQLGQQLEAK